MWISFFFQSECLLILLANVGISKATSFTNSHVLNADDVLEHILCVSCPVIFIMLTAFMTCKWTYVAVALLVWKACHHILWIFHCFRWETNTVCAAWTCAAYVWILKCEENLKEAMVTNEKWVNKIYVFDGWIEWSESSQCFNHSNMWLHLSLTHNDVPLSIPAVALLPCVHVLSCSD